MHLVKEGSLGAWPGSPPPLDLYFSSWLLCLSNSLPCPCAMLSCLVVSQQDNETATNCEPKQTNKTTFSPSKCECQILYFSNKKITRYSFSSGSPSLIPRNHNREFSSLDTRSGKSWKYLQMYKGKTEAAYNWFNEWLHRF